MSLKKLALILSLAFLVFPDVISQQSGWRGPGRSGIYNETGLLKSWPDKGPSILWEVSGIGTGYSSVTVTSDAIYITGRKGEDDVLTSLNPDGKKNWEVIYGKSSKSNA